MSPIGFEASRITPHASCLTHHLMPHASRIISCLMPHASRIISCLMPHASRLEDAGEAPAIPNGLSG